MKVGARKKERKKRKKNIYYWLLSIGTYHENLVI
jgi:hypothetical protein